MLKDKELRKTIGSRAKSRRQELGLNQPYVAEKMGVTASTIQRYEAGTIDNTKKMTLEGLADALHVSVEWLKGETDEYETDITDKRELQIRDVMTSILNKLPYDMEQSESDFSKDLLLRLNYYGIASMKSNIDDINGWLYHRIRMCIWKQWKKPRTKYKNLVKLGIPEHYASTIANSRRKYWYISNNKAVIWALNKERLINSGFYDLATAYQSVHVNY